VIELCQILRISRSVPDARALSSRSLLQLYVNSSKAGGSGSGPNAWGRKGIHAGSEVDSAACSESRSELTVDEESGYEYTLTCVLIRVNLVVAAVVHD
jgi:hypothetical protein